MQLLDHSSASRALKNFPTINNWIIERSIKELKHFGFRKSRPMGEAILALRLLVEGRLRKKKLTHLAFNNFEKAFDSMVW